MDVQAKPADRMDTTALASMLKRIADYGKKGFYHGKTAQTLTNYIQSNGGILPEYAA